MRRACFMGGKHCCLDFQHCLDGCLNGVPYRYCQLGTGARAKLLFGGWEAHGDAKRRY